MLRSLRFCNPSQDRGRFSFAPAHIPFELAHLLTSEPSAAQPSAAEPPAVPPPPAPAATPPPAEEPFPEIKVSPDVAGWPYDPPPIISVLDVVPAPSSNPAQMESPAEEAAPRVRRRRRRERVHARCRPSSRVRAAARRLVRPIAIPFPPRAPLQNLFPSRARGHRSRFPPLVPQQRHRLRLRRLLSRHPSPRSRSRTLCPARPEPSLRHRPSH